MIEEAEHPFPPPDDASNGESAQATEPSKSVDSTKESVKESEEAEPGRAAEAPDEVEEPNDEGGPHLVASSSTGSDGETTGPSTAENSISQGPPVEYEPKQIVGGRASIPEELEPHQLARLKDLKESNA